MKYKLFLDENNYLIGFVHMENEEDAHELNTSEMKLEYLNCYKLVKNKVVFDEEKYNSLVDTKTKEEEINKLKADLSSTDYKIIKCSEYQLAQLEPPYDIAELHVTRQALRDKINELENS